MEITAAAPTECGRVHPKAGYKGVPPEVRDWLTNCSAYDVACKAKDDDMMRAYEKRILEVRPSFTEPGDDGESYHYEQRPFDIPTIDAIGEPSTMVTPRWCRVYDFNPNSPAQLKQYMRVRNHKIPKSKDEDADGNQKDTTAKKELVRLARRVGDSFYLKVIEYRELSKARGTYIDGFKPAADGCVHTTFNNDTGSGQLTSKNPCVQNFPKHGRLSKQLRKMIAPPPGRMIVEIDYRAFHVLTTGFEAESANWMRLARLDMHSFVTWHFLGLPGADALFDCSDDELADKFRWLKSDPDRKRVRDKQAKPSDLGIGFGMGYRRLYQENMEHFENERGAKRFHDLLHRLFPEVFAWQQRIRMRAHQDRILVSKFGLPRRFYEVFRWDSRGGGGWVPGDQAEEAVAFLPAAHAHGHLRSVMKDLADRGIDARDWMGNQIHDALLFFPRTEDVERCVAEASSVMTAPSRILTHPKLAPGGLWCGVEASVGRDWASMEEVKVDVVAGGISR